MRGRFTPRTVAGNLGMLAILGLWYLTLAPTQIGGPGAYLEIQGHSMDPTYATGDLVITKQQDSYAKGDIVAFKAGEGQTQGQVIHRIIGGDGVKGYRVQGDNNPDPDPWTPTDDEVIGKAWMHFEQKAWLLHLPSDPMFAGVTAGVLVLVLLLWDEKPSRRTATQDATSEPADTAATGDAADLPSQRGSAHDSPALPRAR